MDYHSILIILGILIGLTGISVAAHYQELQMSKKVLIAMCSAARVGDTKPIMGHYALECQRVPFGLELIRKRFREKMPSDKFEKHIIIVTVVEANQLEKDFNLTVISGAYTCHGLEGNFEVNKTLGEK